MIDNCNGLRAQAGRELVAPPTILAGFTMLCAIPCHVDTGYRLERVFTPRRLAGGYIFRKLAVRRDIFVSNLQLLRKLDPEKPDYGVCTRMDDVRPDAPWISIKLMMGMMGNVRMW